ncbi:discoidin domain-containing protein [Paenibacillus sinopodophylli]|uniref:discoidin domain-containing protein n=1 Tax=Paenibacillus sinopodophylli TaxID=1837342 RepID=UPI001485E80B|nr:discoidin domain-containing protein [Paenibacillus sinopodophylli]
MTDKMKRFVRRWTCLVIVCSMISSIWFYSPASASTPEATNDAQEIAEMRLMKERIVAFYISRDIINDGTNGRVEWTFQSQAGTYLSSQNANGSWGDVDYANTSSSANGRAWSPYLALDRMQSMAQAFADPSSPYYRSETMIAGIQKALDYWFTVKPTSTNWWETGIGKQLRLEKIAILCEGYLTETQLSNIIATLDSEPNTVDGANSSWYNQNYMFRGLLLEDAQIVRKAVNAFNVLSNVTTTVTGIQSDMSFFMHGKTNYTTGYGRSFARDMSFWAYVTSGTIFSYSKIAIDSLSSYLLDGTRYLVRGDVADLGMGMNGPDWPDYESAALTFYEDPLQWMLAANPARAAEFASFLNNIRQVGTITSNGQDANNMTQWQTLVSSHMRNDFGITVKMSSSTVKGGEWRTIHPSGYNLLYWTPQGATAIQRTGDEYRPIYPLMDWAHVPGTTAPYALTKDGNFNNPKTFVGGVTDERYGATAFDFNKLSTSGKKGYFFFDNEMVALGAGITSTNAASIHTTLNQSQAVGEVLVDGNPLADGPLQTNGRWAYNDNIGYIFPNPTDFKVQRETKTGKWSDVITGSSTAPITQSIFSVWLDHGVKPTNASYQYIVLPNKTSEEVSSYASDNPIRILSNTPSVQAVRHNTLGIAEMLFYKAGTVTVRDGLTVKVDQPAMVIVDESVSPVRISVSNPETPGIIVNVTLNRNGETSTTSYKLGKDTFTGRSITLNENASIDDREFDLAYDKGAAASSSKNNYASSNATDIYRTSYWSSNHSDNEWINVDLQDQYVINRVRLNWENAYGKSYKIQVSDDAVAWRDVYSTTMGDGGIDHISFPSVSTRYVRMQGVQQGTGNGYSLYEFKVFEALSPNLAEGKPIVASSFKAADVAPGNAVDGIVNTRWGSNYSDSQWAYVDLGSSQTIQKVVLSWESYGKEYQIRVSDDATNWTTVYSTANGAGGTDNISFEPVKARYVQMNGIKRGTTYGYSIWEFEVYESLSPNLAEGVPAVASSVRASDVAPGNAVDGILSTRWGSNYSDSEWIYVDLGYSKPIQKVDLHWESAYGKEYQIQVSEDATNWTTVYSTATGAGGIDKISFEPVNARYVRMNGTKRATTYGYSLWEFKVYGIENVQRVPSRIELQVTPSVVTVEGDVSVTGVVYGGDVPLSGVEVEVAASWDSTKTAKAVTDENGQFSTVFTAPSVAGNVTFAVVLPASPSLTDTITVFVNPVAQVPARIELQATPSSVKFGDDVTVTGVVYDRDDLPVSGMEVEITAASGNIQDASLVTDENGRFSTVFTAPSATGEVTITAALTANPSVSETTAVYVNEIVQVPARIELQEVPFPVMSGGNMSVAGVVYDGDDLPVPGVEVEIAASSGSIETANVVTNANGEFNTVFTAPSTAGEVTITVVLTASPIVVDTITVSVIKAVRMPVLIELQATPSSVMVGNDVSIAGIVYDGDNLSVSGVEVKVSALWGSIETAKAVTDENGRFSTIFTAPSAAGEVTITAVLTASPSVTGRINVSVNERSNGGGGGNSGGGTPVTPPLDPDDSNDGPDVPVPGHAFADIAGHWAEANILEAEKKGIITGYTDGSFRPDRTVTRAEFAVMLAKALKLQNEESVLSFKDADRIGKWARTAVAQAVSLGLIQGDKNGNFRPDAAITRSEMAVMLARALNLASETGSTGFADDRDIPDWAVGAAAELKKLGIMQGKGGNGFFPNNVATRAETVTVLLRMLAAKD